MLMLHMGIMMVCQRRLVKVWGGTLIMWKRLVKREMTMTALMVSIPSVALVVTGDPTSAVPPLRRAWAAVAVTGDRAAKAAVVAMPAGRERVAPSA
jgi:hypothetical protein